MLPLRHAGAGSWLVRKTVALDDCDPLEVFAQRLGRDQAGHAASEHDRVPVWLRDVLRHIDHYRGDLARVH